MNFDERALMMLMRCACPAEIYRPHRIEDVIECISSGDVFDDSIRVEVQDTVREFAEGGYLPTQRVTIEFEFCSLHRIEGVGDFGRILKQKGCLPAKYEIKTKKEKK